MFWVRDTRICVKKQIAQEQVLAARITSMSIRLPVRKQRLLEAFGIEYRLGFRTHSLFKDWGLRNGSHRMNPSNAEPVQKSHPCCWNHSFWMNFEIIFSFQSYLDARKKLGLHLCPAAKVPRIEPLATLTRSSPWRLGGNLWASPGCTWRL